MYSVYALYFVFYFHSILTTTQFIPYGKYHYKYRWTQMSISSTTTDNLIHRTEDTNDYKYTFKTKTTSQIINCLVYLPWRI